MKLAKGCVARQHADQFICVTCGLVWDANDSEPPVCDPIPEGDDRLSAVARKEAEQ